MPSTQLPEVRQFDARYVAAALKASDFSRCSITIVGFGAMGQQYLNAARALGISRIRICSRTEGSLRILGDERNISSFSGGYQAIAGPAVESELAVVATPIPQLATAVRHLVLSGFRNILVENN